jgi:hypothetical protein
MVAAIRVGILDLRGEVVRISGIACTFSLTGPRPLAPDSVEMAPKICREKRISTIERSGDALNKLSFTGTVLALPSL